MRKTLIVALTLFTLSISAQEINWMTLEEAVIAQNNKPKKIIIDAFTTWCGPCKMLEKNTFQNKDVAEYINKNYYAVKFNAEGNETINFKGNTFTNPNFDPNKTGRNSPHQLSSYFGVRAYPTIIFLDEEANLLGPIPGYQSPQQLEIFLNLFKDDTYKSVTTKEAWEDYIANFKHEFRETNPETGLNLSTN
ncbi:thioredoxin fold domain-containing protein [Lutibacter sp. B1]|uniref:thioredoxin family protein n=1 Tax=Lutibacter sp. B1 TaxID=2725996 RepID=UPI0014572949|nr:thioredoxin fold domain-containing protein [Lutibacter sp. B1]NLP58897.1 thioredoxin fold domain-containing protein [Lutibacter sp. B1]